MALLLLFVDSFTFGEAQQHGTTRQRGACYRRHFRHHQSFVSRQAENSCSSEIERNHKQRCLLKFRRCGTLCVWDTNSDFSARPRSFDHTEKPESARVTHEDKEYNILEFLDSILPGFLHRIQLRCAFSCAKVGRRSQRYWFFGSYFVASVHYRGIHCFFVIQERSKRA